MNPGSEIYLRLYILNHLQVTDKEFRKIYSTFKPESLLAHIEENIILLEIDTDKIAC